MRKWSGITRPATTASPSPQLASIMRSSAPVTGFCGEHHAGGVGVEQRLDDDADARAGEQADPLAVGDRRVRVRRPPDLAQRRGTSSADGTLSRVRCWPAKLAVGAVFVDGRRAHRERAPSGRDRFADFLDRLLVPRGDGLDEAPESATPGGTGRPVARRVAKPDRLRAEERRLARLRRAGRPLFTRAP